MKTQPISSILPLKVDKLSFEIGGRRLLHELSFELESHTRSIFLGPNGAGKSLVLRLCHGLAAPTNGTIRWNRVSPGEARTRQAMVFQRPVMLRRSVSANVGYALACRGVPRPERAAIVADALDRTGLSDHARVPARVLSVGQQQRLALARVWVMRPEVLFLDEPTAGLDPIGASEFDDLLRSLRDALGFTVFMITHDLDTIYAICDRVAVVADRKVVAVAPVAELEKSDHPWIKSYFLGPRGRAAARLKDH